jgi:hypothetical protein
MKKYLDNHILRVANPFKAVRLFCLLWALVAGVAQVAYAQITNGMNASDLIGQYTTTAGFTNRYTTSTANNSNGSTYALGLSIPQRCLIDKVDHRAFVVDETNNRVLVFNLDANNNLVDKTPDFVLGQPNFTSSTAAITQAGMDTPADLAYDASTKMLFVCQQAPAHRVTVYDVTTITNGENAINVLGQANFTSSVAASTQAGMNVPSSLAYDAVNKRLFVGQSLVNKVTVYDVTTITNGENAINVLGQANFTSSAAATTQAGMETPNSLVYDDANNRLFVGEGLNSRVIVFDVATITNGENAINVLGQANFTTATVAVTQAGMANPRGLAYDATNQMLFVSQITGNRITVYDVTSITNGENAINVLGQANFTASAAATTQAGLNSPQKLEFDASTGKLYVADRLNNRIMLFDVVAPLSATAVTTNATCGSDGTITQTVTGGTAPYTYAWTGGATTKDRTGLTAGNYTVTITDAALATVTYTYTVNAVVAIADGANAIDLIGQYTTTAGFTPNYTQATANNNNGSVYALGLRGPASFVIDEVNHRAFVGETSNNRILVFNLDANNNLIDKTPDFVLGQPNFTTSALATTQAGLRGPIYLAYDAVNQRLFASQLLNNRISVFDVASITNGENAINVLGQTSFTTSTAATTQAGLSGPGGVAYDATNNRLFVAEASNRRVVVYDVTTITNGENAINVLGQANFTSSLLGPTQAILGITYDVAYDAANNRLFVADNGYPRVMVFDVATITNGENAINVLGQANFTSSTAATTQTGMDDPQGIAYDAINNRLFVAQSFQNRITVYDVASITNGENAINVLGQASFTTATAATTQAGLSGPSKIRYYNGKLYVPETDNNRITVFDAAAAVACVSGSIASQTNIVCKGASTGAVTVTATGGTAPYTYNIDGGTFGTSATFTGLAAGAHTVSIKDATAATFDVPVTLTEPATLIDTDGDGVCNDADLDDDNDGILDTNEGVATCGLNQNGFNEGILQASYHATLISTAGDWLITGQNLNGSGANQLTFAYMSNLYTYPANSKPLHVTIGGLCSVIALFDNNQFWAAGHRLGSATSDVIGNVIPMSTRSNSTNWVLTTISLPAGVAATDVKKMKASGNMLMIITKSGLMYVLGTEVNLQLNSAFSQTVFNQIPMPSGVTVKDAKIAENSLFILGSNGSFYRYGQVTYDGDGTNSAAITTTADLMTQPPLTGSLVQFELGNNGAYYVLDSDNKVYVLGFNGSGQLGIGNTTNSTTWTTIPSVSNAKFITATNNSDYFATDLAGYSAGFVDNNKQIRVFGGNSFNSLTDAAAAIQTTPVLASGVNANVASFVLGGHVSPYLNSDYNTIYNTGHNSGGGFGDGTTTDRTQYQGTSLVGIVSGPLVNCSSSIDTDGDGIFNYLDTDSDNDGCADAIEGGGTFTSANIDGSGRLTGGVGSNGVPTIAGAGQTAGNSQNNALRDMVCTPLSVSSSPVTCFGGSNGFINITVNSGTPPYTYNWGGGITTEDRTGLAAGTYNLTVTDNTGSTATASVTITQPTALTAAGVITQPTCTVGGSINLTPSGGTSPYTYDWADIAGTNNPEDRSGLVGGNYSVTVTDAKGCTATASFTLATPACTPTYINVCKSNTADVYSVTPDPTITTYTWTVTGGGVIASGQGTPSVSVNWTGATGSTGTVCCKTVNSCGESANTCKDVYIMAPIAGAAVAAPVCAGSNMLLSGSGGVSYQWSGPSSFTANSEAPVINNVTAANAGTYTVTVTDASGCSATATVAVTVSTPPTATTVVTTASCGASNGTVALTPAGGTSPYTYLWSNGATTQNLSSLSAAGYTVTVTDNNGCKAVTTANVGNTSAQTITLTPTNVACFGGSTGQIVSSVSGGTAPFTYFWSTGATTANLTSVGLGGYSVTVTGANGCDAVASATLIQPNELAVNSAVTQVYCIGGATGAINLTVTGGTTPYTYNWGGGITTEDRTGLSAGTYNVTITDANTCSITRTITIIQPVSPFTATATVTNVKCNGGANGVVNLTASGGTYPYSYLWSNGATTEDIFNRTSGTYTVTVTDARGCVATLSRTITQPAALSLTNTVTSVNCNGGATGAINLTPTGGTPSLSISWSNGVTTEDLTAISAGTYGVTVTDANACTATVSISVTQPTATLTATATPTNVTCNGGTTGSISMAIAGGTTAYTYLWSSGQTTQNLTSIGAGTYTLTVTDARGCQAVAQSTLTQPTAILLTGAVTNVACNGGSTGAISLTTTNGVGALTYNWGGGITSQNRTAIAAGTYTVTVTDANSCTTTSSFIVTQPAAPLAATSTKTDATCAGNADGSVNLSVTGGSLPYTYSWSNGATTEDISSLAAGTYTVTVTDARSCTTTRSVTITQPAAFVLSATTTSAACEGGTDGTINLTVSGGISPYTYNWSNGTTTEDITGVTAGNYNVTVTGANGCSAVRSNIAVSETNTLTITSTVSNNLCPGSNKGSINLTITGGTAPFTYNWSNGATTKDITGLTSGTYTIIVKDATNCVETFGFTITEPNTGTALTLATITTPSNCGASTGAVDLTPTGGITPYTYTWSNSATTQDITSVAAGTYTVSVTDAQGCVQTSTNLVNNNAAPTLTSTVNNVACKSGTTGSITLNVSGGASPYTYSWSNSTSAASLTGVGVGSYTVTVTAANGCKVIASNTITEPATALSVVTNQNAPNCIGTGGEAFATPSGGTAPYTYAWSNSATTASISNLSPATYTVTVTDARSCPVNGSVVITAAACLPPVAVNDNFTTPLNTPITQTVAPNDSDPDGLAADLIFTLLTNPTVSQGVINFDNTYGNFTFTPTTGFTGTVTLNYQVCDLTNLCTTGTLTINVTANVIPVTESGTSPATGGTPIANVRSNDTVNGAAATSSNSTISQIGVWQSGITLNTTTGAITVANGTTPGVYSVTYQLCDLATPTPNCATVADFITVTPDCNATTTVPILIKN